MCVCVYQGSGTYHLATDGLSPMASQQVVDNICSQDRLFFLVDLLQPILQCMNKFMLNLTCFSYAERISELYRQDVRRNKVYCLVHSSLPSNVLIPALPVSLFSIVLLSKTILNHLRDNEKDGAFLPHYPYDSILSIVQNAGHAPLNRATSANMLTM